MEYLDSIAGLQREQAGSGRSYAIANPESKDLANDIIEGLPENRELMFYDKSYDSPSDPGAYVMVRTFSGRYLYRLGNHGWSSGWRRRGKNSLVEYLSRALSASGNLWLDPCDPAEAQKILRLPGPLPKT